MLPLRPIQKAAAGIALLGITVFGVSAPPANAQSGAISIEVSTNGIDADGAPGPTLTPGDAVAWTYLVTVNGPTTLYDLIVSDSSGVTPNCDINGDGGLDGTHIHPGPLDSGQSFRCSATGIVHGAQNGTYSTIGRVRGFDFSGATPFDAQDPTHYTPQPQFIPRPNMAVQTSINGLDGQSQAGPYIAEGSPLTIAYVVTNTGNVPLSSITIDNSDGLAISCSGGQSNIIPGPLAPKASATCTAEAEAAAFDDGPQSISGAVAATAVDPTTGGALSKLTAQDPSSYTPVEPPGVLAFTGPADGLPGLGLALFALGLGVWLTGLRMGRRRPIA